MIGPYKARRRAGQPPIIMIKMATLKWLFRPYLPAQRLATQQVIFITTHYSAAELEELINAAEAIVSRGRTETPNLMLIRQRTDRSVGKVSEIKKGLTEKIG